MKILLENDAKIERRSREGMTALMFASGFGHLAIVQALLAKGANIDHEAENGATALIVASENGHEVTIPPCWPRVLILIIRPKMVQRH